MTKWPPIKGLRDIEKIEAVPLKERLRFPSTYEMIAQGAAIQPNAPALFFIPDGELYDKPSVFTYDQLLGRIRQAANLFHDFGLRSGEVVSILLPNLPETHFSIWGAQAAGVANPINPFLGVDTIKEILTAAKTKILVALGPTPRCDIWQKVDRLRKEAKLEVVLQVCDQGDPGTGSQQDGVFGFGELLDRHDRTKLSSNRRTAPDEIASLFHTGGTSGIPKLAPHTHGNEIFDAWAMASSAGASSNDVVLCGLPMFHVNGVIVTGLMPFSVGASVVLLSPWGYRDKAILRNFFRIVSCYRATLFSAVPTVMSALSQLPAEPADLSSLRYAVCGAAPLPGGVFLEFERRTGVKILEGYGLTEATCASSVNPRDGERRCGSIGLRLPYQEMKTVAVDAAGRYVRDCAAGEIGVVALKGPNVFPGYLQENQNQNIWLKDQWLNTGDLGKQDEDGYFWLTGRAKDLIIRGGHNIDPASIEAPLCEHPAVALAAAVGSPDAYAGEVPVAYVVLNAGAETTEAQLMEHCRRRIGEPMAVPKFIVIVDTMPITAVGKIFKPQLRHDAVRRVIQRELEILIDERLVEDIVVEVREHPTRGTLAAITAKLRPGVDNEQAIQRMHAGLASYSIDYDLQTQYLSL